MYIVDNCTVHSKYINKSIISRVMWTYFDLPDLGIFAKQPICLYKPYNRQLCGRKLLVLSLEEEIITQIPHWCMF